VLITLIYQNTRICLQLFIIIARGRINYKRNLWSLFFFSSRGTMLATHTHLAQRLKIIGVALLFSLYAFFAQVGSNCTFIFHIILKYLKTFCSLLISPTAWPYKQPTTTSQHLFCLESIKQPQIKGSHSILQLTFQLLTKPFGKRLCGLKINTPEDSSSIFFLILS